VATPRSVDDATICMLVVTPDRGSSRLVRNLGIDPRFTRIARAVTPYETPGRAGGSTRTWSSSTGTAVTLSARSLVP